MEKKGIILDMDGVIVDSIDMHKKAMSKIIKKHNIPFSLSRWDEINGMNIPDTFRYIKRKYGGDFELYDVIQERKEANIGISKKAPLFKGVRTAIKNLSSKYCLILATSALKEEADNILDRHNLRQYFACTATGEDIKESKPNPEIFTSCADKLNLPREACVVVEDSPNGVKAAQKAGMKIVGVATTHEEEELRGADLIIDNPSLLVSAVENVVF